MASLARSIRPARRNLALLARSFSTTAPRPQNDPSSLPSRELDVGELQGAKFKIEPLRRIGEDEHTMRARLLYQSRKRGILESDLLLSTFANTHLQTMSLAQMSNYDLFLDENDWDIYYWATQDEVPPADLPTAAADTEKGPHPAQGEWAQTVGAFKPAYRPVPARWKGSEVLTLLREHVRSKRAGGEETVPGEKKGMGFMPPLFEMKRGRK